MQQARKDVNYHIIAIDDMPQTKPKYIQTLLKNIRNLLEQKKVTALPITVYSIEQVREAFTTMQKAQHVGKIIITQPRLLTQAIDANASYLITGGLGGLGLITAKWLVQLGAKHIVLVSRSKPNNEKQVIIAGLGIDIKAIYCDVSDADQVKNLIASLQKERALKGIFHLAGILDDGILAEQTPERFEKVFAPKAIAAWALHEATQNISTRLLRIIFIDCIQYGISGAEQLRCSERLFRSISIISKSSRLERNQH